MRIGINMPLKDASGRPLTGEGIRQRAEMVEHAGLDGIWLGDGLPSMARPDPLMWLLMSASSTAALEIGTCIFIATIRNPIDMAQRFTTLQALYPGRFSIGVGAGSGRPGQEMLGYDFDERFSRLHENLRIIREICDGASPNQALGRPVENGARSTMPQYGRMEPWPTIVGRPRFLLGAWHSEISLKRAIADYDGWMCSASRTNFNTMAEAIKRYRDLGGRRAMVSTCLVNLSAPTEKVSDDDSFFLQCEPNAAAQRLHRLAELGFDDVLLVKSDYPRELALYEADFTLDELEQIRSLLPKDSSSYVTS